jgi:hypothetical protein
VDRSSDHLTLQWCSNARAILTGLACIGGAVFLVWFVCTETQQSDWLWRTLIVLVALALASGGVWRLFVRPDIFVFDRPTGKLTVLHRTLLSQKREDYPLSDIEAVLLVVVPGDADRGECYYLSLALRNRGSNSSHDDTRLRMTEGGMDSDSERDKAKRVAAFLGLAVRDEIEKHPWTRSVSKA